jgi:hypothetical protein
MRTYRCLCGNGLFFDNGLCLACEREVGLCPACRNLVALVEGDDGKLQCGNPECNSPLAKCFNYSEYEVCNRCVVPTVDDGSELCDCCRFNQTIPDPPADWAERYISAYASMHPWEDFAETWGTCLAMVGALDTTHHRGLSGESDPQNADVAQMIVRYQQLGISLNEMNRSMGLLDLAPEIIVAPVVEKLAFIHELVQQGRAENGALQPQTSAPERGVH